MRSSASTPQSRFHRLISAGRARAWRVAGTFFSTEPEHALEQLRIGGDVARVGGIGRPVPARAGPRPVLASPMRW